MRGCSITHTEHSTPTRRTRNPIAQCEIHSQQNTHPPTNMDSPSPGTMHKHTHTRLYNTTVHTFRGAVVIVVIVVVNIIGRTHPIVCPRCVRLSALMKSHGRFVGRRRSCGGHLVLAILMRSFIKVKMACANYDNGNHTLHCQHGCPLIHTRTTDATPVGRSVGRSTATPPLPPPTPPSTCTYKNSDLCIMYISDVVRVSVLGISFGPEPRSRRQARYATR